MSRAEDPDTDQPLTITSPNVQPGDDTAAVASQGLLGITAKMTVYKVISTGALAVVGVVTARQLEPSGRGVLVLLLTIAAFSLLISSFGINLSGRVHLVGRVPIPSGDFMGLAGALVLAQFGLCILLGVTLLPTVDARLSLTQEVLFGALGAVMLAQLLLNDALNAYGHTTLATAVDAAGSTAQLVGVVAVASTGSKSVTAFVATFVVANGFQSALGLLALHRKGVALRPRFHRQSWRLLLRSGLPGIPTSLGQTLAFRVDRYLIGLYMNPAAVGIYAVAATAPEFLRLPSLVLSQPIVYRLASGSASYSEFRRVRFLCVAGTVALAAFFFVTAPFVIRFAFGADYLDAVTPLRILLLGEAGIAVNYLAAGSLAALNRISDAAWAAMAGLAVVALGDVLLIPSHGLVGAAWASAVGYTVMGLVAQLLLRRVDDAVLNPSAGLAVPGDQA